MEDARLLKFRVVNPDSSIVADSAGGGNRKTRATIQTGLQKGHPRKRSRSGLKRWLWMTTPDTI